MIALLLHYDCIDHIADCICFDCLTHSFLVYVRIIETFAMLMRLFTGKLYNIRVSLLAQQTVHSSLFSRVHWHGLCS